ncbi:uncharacterized protein LOC135384419 [Ornithodoros turicata]|uniref:uncharacterized protein LOC135384419 n=1 Tax=Ornithodoros turicata TaxID=34597 RepID=UPI003139BEE8
MWNLSPNKLLAPFDEKKDELDAYILRFERIAAGQKWPEDQWAVALSMCLTDRLRNSKPADGETASQYYSRLGNYFDRWIELASIKKEYGDLRDLMLSEQFLKDCRQDLALYLKERKSKTTAELLELADHFQQAQRQTRLGRQVTSDPKRPETQGRANADNPTGSKGNSRPFVKCFLCNKIGHRAADCRSNFSRNQRSTSCWKCGKNGHRANDCSNQPTAGSQSSCFVTEEQAVPGNAPYVELKDGTQVPVVNALSSRATMFQGNGLPVVPGEVEGQHVKVLRDTGSNTVVVRKSLMREGSFTGKRSAVYLVDRTIRYLPEARVTVSTPYYEGEVMAKCMDDPVYDLVLGNIAGVRDVADPNPDWRTESEISVQTPVSPQDEEIQEQPSKPSCNLDKSAAMQTRAQTRKESKLKALKVPASVHSTGTGLAKEQTEDSSLKACFNKLGKVIRCKRSKGSQEFFMKNDLLFRRFTLPSGRCLEQLVLPTGRRRDAMRAAHDGMMSGHQGIKKTTDRVTQEFYWPGMQEDIQRYVKSCDVCQKTTPKGKVTKAPLGRVPIIDTPFQRVAVDIVGPISLPSDRGNRYLLTLVDYATRYPDAVALPSIESERVAEALVEMFSRVGVPREVLSDRGSNFTSEMMREVDRLLSVKHLTTTPYHPIANGLVEKFNGTFKQMLRRMCAERPKDWDRYVAALLFAYREVPQTSLGFSPFELLYGRHVRGPLSLLKDIWTNADLDAETKTTYQYVLDLRNRLEDTCKVAHEALAQSREKYERYYNRRAKEHKLEVNDKVLILLPTSNNKLVMHWKGPFPVTSKKSDLDYEVDLGSKRKIFHINMLKRYEERKEAAEEASATWVCGMPTLQDPGDETDLPVPSLETKESYKDVTCCGDLSAEQKGQADDILREFAFCLTDIPGKTSFVECDLKTTTNLPVNIKQYPLPFATREIVGDEVDKMLQLGIIERSVSAYNSPVVIVKKSDGTNRLCVDYRRLNDVLVPDSEPIPRADIVFAKVGQRRYFSKFDCVKGYWQIPLTETSKEKTAFSTSAGHFQFKFMPFGIKTAPAVFSRLMQRLFHGMSGVHHYFDDILLATDTWEEHLELLREVLARVATAGLTVRPAKSQIGFAEINFLGHNLGRGTLSAMPETLERIRDAPQPKTKTQVRSFLGLTGYYREFIPNYAAITAPLTELTKKQKSNQVVWTAEHETAFRELKRMLAEPPILRLPDFSRPFTLRTDASEVSLGAILLQEHEGVYHPVAYASRKLLPREAAYSAIEREGLALVWGIQRFHIYLYGTQFTVQSDHEPLRYINRSKHLNSRILRWSLLLQEYEFRVEYIRGSENVGADYLSRVEVI